MDAVIEQNLTLLKENKKKTMSMHGSSIKLTQLTRNRLLTGTLSHAAEVEITKEK